MSHHSRVPTVVGGQFILRLLLVTATVLGIALTSAPAQASKYAGFVIDANTGKTLYSSAADSARYPASLTKMMTLYLVFDALKSGKISKKSRITMSREAASRPPSTDSRRNASPPTRRMMLPTRMGPTSEPTP